jgi:hypothetical protein
MNQVEYLSKSARRVALWRPRFLSRHCLFHPSRFSLRRTSLTAPSINAPAPRLLFLHVPALGRRYP